MWLLFEQVPKKLYLPAFQQRHEITFSLGDVPSCECKCPYFTSTRLPCCAVCALLARKGFSTTAQMCPFLHSMWLVKNHPLYVIATRPAAAEPTVTLQASETLTQDRVAAADDGHPSQTMVSERGSSCAIEEIHRHNADALRNLMIPTDTNGRRNFLSTMFQQILPGAAASAVVTREVIVCFLVQRAKLGNSQSLIAAPDHSITRRQDLAGQGPATAVRNLAVYNPARRHRVSTAKLNDPACYVVHKQAGQDQPVKCLCGVIYNNNHKVSLHSFFIHAFLNSNVSQVAFAHRKSTEHKTWLENYKATQGLPAHLAAQVQVHGPGAAGDSELQVYRLSPPSYSIIIVHRCPG